MFHFDVTLKFAPPREDVIMQVSIKAASRGQAEKLAQMKAYDAYPLAFLAIVHLV